MLYQLNWPLLRPTIGQKAVDSDRGVSQAYPFIADVDLARVCGTPDLNQMAMVASGLRADGNRLELWIAPTSTGRVVNVLLTMRHNGAPMGAASRCNDEVEVSYADAGTEIADGESVGIIDISGRTSPNATQARITFTSGKVVLAAVHTDGYFVVSIQDSIAGYSEVESVEGSN